MIKINTITVKIFPIKVKKPSWIIRSVCKLFSIGYPRPEIYFEVVANVADGKYFMINDTVFANVDNLFRVVSIHENDVFLIPVVGDKLFTYDTFFYLNFNKENYLQLVYRAYSEGAKK